MLIWLGLGFRLVCAEQFSAIDPEPVLVAIKCKFATIGYFSAIRFAFALHFKELRCYLQCFLF
ncbi:hypothetical protein AXE76_00655 [Gardnerella vaginalis]|uniref:Uncharacterized protein n=1 Tax=Gardnerella vaginalis TaxID=2702 RepID=A0A3E1IP27_GARVA|nr:hypothetical protein AXE76_00655 [Gardnerella vaginalis]